MTSSCNPLIKDWSGSFTHMLNELLLQRNRVQRSRVHILRDIQWWPTGLLNSFGPGDILQNYYSILFQSILCDVNWIGMCYNDTPGWLFDIESGNGLVPLGTDVVQVIDAASMDLIGLFHTKMSLDYKMGLNIYRHWQNVIVIPLT